MNGKITDVDLHYRHQWSSTRYAVRAILFRRSRSPNHVAPRQEKIGRIHQFGHTRSRNIGTSRGNGCQCDRGEKRAISLGHGEPCCRSAPHAGLLNRLCMLNLAVCRAIVHHTKSSVGWPSKSGTQDCVWSALEFFVNNPARLSDGLCEYMSFWCHCDFLHLCILDVTWLQYRQRVLDAPDLRPIFFFSRGVDLSKPAGPNIIPQNKVRAAASVFEADWPMKKMIRDALKNEK
jgi:hypothetical protein